MRITIETQNDYESLSVCELLKFLKNKDKKGFSTIVHPEELQKAEKAGAIARKEYSPDPSWTWAVVAEYLGVSKPTAVSMNKKTGEKYIVCNGRGRGSMCTNTEMLDRLKQEYAG